MCAQQSISGNPVLSTGPSLAPVTSASGVAKTGDTSPHASSAARAARQITAELRICRYVSGNQIVCSFSGAGLRLLKPLTRIIMICLQRASTLCSQGNGCCWDFPPVEARVPSCGDVARSWWNRTFTPAVNEQLPCGVGFKSTSTHPLDPDTSGPRQAQLPPRVQLGRPLGSGVSGGRAAGGALRSRSGQVRS